MAVEAAKGSSRHESKWSLGPNLYVALCVTDEFFAHHWGAAFPNTMRSPLPIGTSPLPIATIPITDRDKAMCQKLCFKSRQCETADGVKKSEPPSATIVATSAVAHQQPRLPRQGRLPPVHLHHGPALAPGARLPRRHGAGRDPNIELSWMGEEVLGIQIGHPTNILCRYRLPLPGLRHSAFKLV